ncbi:MAG: hypothetical protein ACJA1E_001466 [Paracoccaceae bacterium]|jgi:hypothetical protein
MQVWTVSLRIGRVDGVRKAFEAVPLSGRLLRSKRLPGSGAAIAL